MKRMLLIFSAISLNGAINAMQNDPQNKPSSHNNKFTPNDDNFDPKYVEIGRKITEIREAMRARKILEAARAARKNSALEKPTPEKQDLSKEELERQITALANNQHSMQAKL